MSYDNNSDRNSDARKAIADISQIIRRSLKQSFSTVEIKPESSLVDDLGLDSLRMVDVTLDIEDHFGVTLTELEKQSAVTVADLAATVLKHSHEHSQ